MKYVVTSEIILGSFAITRNTKDGKISNIVITIAISGNKKDSLYILDSRLIDLAIIRVMEKKININPITETIFNKYTLNRLFNCPFWLIDSITPLKNVVSNDIDSFVKVSVSSIFKTN